MPLAIEHVLCIQKQNSCCLALILSSVWTYMGHTISKLNFSKSIFLVSDIFLKTMLCDLFEA